MAYHIGIGEIDYDNVIFIGFDSLNKVITHFISTHLRLQIVSRNLR